ncbi:MAG: hypothetical protein AB2551_15865, partial [Candidatus Thiodiazotropha sp.]
FAKWIDDDRIMEDPDLVANEYAVHSAVFYWDKNNLNKVADKDDVVRMTKAINGGQNGLAHRTELLTKAKGLLAMLDLKPTRRA